jgi:hypothetical protein
MLNELALAMLFAILVDVAKEYYKAHKNQRHN